MIKQQSRPKRKHQDFLEIDVTVLEEASIVYKIFKYT